MRPEIYEVKQSKLKGRYGRWYTAQKEARSENYERTKESNKQRIKTMWLEDPKRAMVYIAKNRAKVKGLPFNLCADDFEIPEYCPLLGLKLERGIGKAAMNSPELDRIVPSLGYVNYNYLNSNF